MPHQSKITVSTHISTQHNSFHPPLQAKIVVTRKAWPHVKGMSRRFIGDAHDTSPIVLGSSDAVNHDQRLVHFTSDPAPVYHNCFPCGMWTAPGICEMFTVFDDNIRAPLNHTCDEAHAKVVRWKKSSAPRIRILSDDLRKELVTQRRIPSGANAYVYMQPALSTYTNPTGQQQDFMAQMSYIVWKTRSGSYSDGLVFTQISVVEQADAWHLPRGTVRTYKKKAATKRQRSSREHRIPKVDGFLYPSGDESTNEDDVLPAHSRHRREDASRAPVTCPAPDAERPEPVTCSALLSTFARAPASPPLGARWLAAGRRPVAEHAEGVTVTSDDGVSKPAPPAAQTVDVSSATAVCALETAELPSPEPVFPWWSWNAALCSPRMFDLHRVDSDDLRASTNTLTSPVEEEWPHPWPEYGE